MEHLITPAGYKPVLDLRETQVAIKEIKDFFQRELAKQLNLTRVSAPLFVLPESRLIASAAFGDGGYGFSFVFSLIMSASCGCSPGTYGTTFLTFFSQLLISSFLSACGQEMHPDFIPSFCFFGKPCES